MGKEREKKTPCTELFCILNGREQMMEIFNFFGACKCTAACNQHHPCFPVNINHSSIAPSFPTPNNFFPLIPPAVTLQPAFLGCGFPVFPCPGCGLGADPGGTERRGCCRARSHWKANRLPARGAQGVLGAALQLQTSSTDCQGRNTLRAGELCSRGFGDSLLSPGT